MSAPNTYSFLDTHCAIIGPGGAFPLGSGSGNAKEGITVEFDEDKDKMTIGADGSGMHTLMATKSGKVTIRLLKTSPTNQLLAALYNFQTISSATHGQNVITLADVARGDGYTCQQCAFVRFPKNEYGEEAGTIEWVFNSVAIDAILGTGAPSAN